MTDRYRVYTKVKKMLKQMMKMAHPGQVITLSMMISGIVMSRNAQLSVMTRLLHLENRITKGRCGADLHSLSPSLGNTNLPRPRNSRVRSQPLLTGR